MPSYTWKLTDIRADALTPWFPVVRVRPEVEAFGPDGLVSEVPVVVNPDMYGTYTVSLFASGDLTPAVGGGSGVDYVIEVGRFDESIDGHRFSGTDLYRFTAAAGGGAVAQMQGGSTLAVWVGPPIGEWPQPPLPKGMYIDPTGMCPWGVVS